MMQDTSQESRAVSRLGPWKGYALLVGFHLLFSLAFIIIFSHTFYYRRLSIPLHLVLVGFLILAVTLLMGFLISLGWFRRARIARWVLAAIPATAFALLVSLYTVDWISNKAWASNVTWQLVRNFLPQTAALVKTFPFDPGYVYVPVLVIAVAIFAAYGWLSKRMLAGLEEMFLAGRTWSVFRTRKRALVTVFAAGVALAAFASFTDWTVRSPRRFWRGEPIMGLFLPLTNLGDDTHRMAVAVQDRRVRSEYPKDVPFDRKNVVLIMADSLRADHMQVYGYTRATTPFLERQMQTG